MGMTDRELEQLLARNPEIAVQDGYIHPDYAPIVTARKASEHEEQAAVFAWADAAEVEHPELRMLYAVPNGGHRHPAVAAMMKAEGQRAGVPDMCLPVARGRWHSLYIELKVRPNKPTAEQVDWIERLRYYGNSAIVCYGAQEAINAIMAYLRME